MSSSFTEREREREKDRIFYDLRLGLGKDLFSMTRISENNYNVFGLLWGTEAVVSMR